MGFIVVGAAQRACLFTQTHETTARALLATKNISRAYKHRLQSGHELISESPVGLSLLTDSAVELWNTTILRASI